MSLTENSTKGNYIKLIVSTGSQPTISDKGSEGMPPFKEIDIADKILGEVDNFNDYTLRGVRWQVGNTGQTQVFADLRRLKDIIDWEAERIFDACIVNEKQKKAIKELFNTRMYDAFQRDWKDLELSLLLLKKNEK